jgi:hypothetical protein
VSRGSGPRLPAREGSSVPNLLQLRILPPYRGVLWSVACPTTLNPACAARQACSQRMRACFQGAWRRAIMGLQDVQAGYVVNAYKTCV